MSQTKAQLISDLVQALNFTGTSSAPANGMYLSAANTISLSTNSTAERLTISSTGSVVFSTATAGTFKIKGTATGTNVNSQDAGTYLQLQNLSTAANTFTVLQGVDGSGQGTSQIAFVNLVDAENKGQMVFGTRPSNGTMLTALTLDSSQNATFVGNVNLANTKTIKFPGAGVDAGATIKHQSGNFEINNDTGNTYFDAAASHYLRTGGSTIALTLDGSQNATFAGHINLPTGYSLQWSDSHERIEQSDGKIEFFTGNGQKMTLSSDNLGIGTSSPSALFDCEIAATDKLEYGNNPRLFLQCATGNNGLRIWSDTTPIEARTDNSSRFFMVGGGPNHDTTLAGKTCTALSTFDSSPKLFFNATYWNGSASVTAFQTSIQAVATSAASNGGYLGLGASATPDDLVILPTGKVGIGLTSGIQSKLHVQDVEGTTLTLGNTDAAASDGDYLSGIDFWIKDNNDSTGAATASIRTYADQNHTATAKGTALAFHTTDDDTTTLDERMRITHDGKVGIGTTSPESKLHISASMDGLFVGDITAPTSGDEYANLMVKNSQADGYSASFTAYNASGKGLKIYNNGGSAARHALLVSQAGGVRFGVDGNGDVNVNTGNLKIGASGKGISFYPNLMDGGTGSGTPDPIDNTLDDYEEGRFDFTCPSGGLTLTNNDSGYDSHYIKIGRFVHIQFYIGIGSGTHTGSALEFDGLPFDAAPHLYSVGTIDFGKGGKKGAYMRITQNTNNVEFLYPSENTSNDRIQIVGTDIGTSTYMIGTMTYYTDANN